MPSETEQSRLDTEKTYYAALVLLCAASMLLSPFFFIRKSRTARWTHTGVRQWRRALLLNFLIAAAAVWIWRRWF